MAFDAAAYPEYKVAVFRFSGTVEDTQLASASDCCLRMKGRSPEFGVVADIRDTIVEDITVTGMMRIVESISNTVGGVRFMTALLVDNKPGDERSRVYQALSAMRHQEVQVFWDSHLAAEWIGCPAELLDR